MKNFIGATFSIAIMASLVFANQANADIAVVVHKDNPTQSITAKEGKKIFLGVSTKFNNGTKIDLVDQKGNKELRSELYSRIAEKTVAQINSRWAGLIFSGEAIPPTLVDNDEDVIEWLEDNPNGIGYINSKYLDNRVKPILMLP